MVYQYLNDIRAFNNSTQSNIERYKKIKWYAIKHTDFYASYIVDDVFPIMTKIDLIKNYDRIKSKENFDKPLHIFSTSGSTGIPFSVEQDYNKRNE